MVKNKRYLYLDPEQPIEVRVKDLLSRMTLEEKVGQLLQYGGQRCVDEDGRFSWEKIKELIEKHKVGSFFYFTRDQERICGPKELAERTNEIQKIAKDTRLGIPVITGDDVYNGYTGVKGMSIFPARIAMASTWNPDLIQEVASATARETRSTGIHWAFAPTLSVLRDPRWGRTNETLGEDPYLISRMGVAIVKGFQGKDIARPEAILAGPKHFAADGESEGGLNGNPVEMSQRTLRELILPPFKDAVKAGAGNIMAAHHSLNGIPCHADYKLLTEILRQEWGFNGFVASDFTDIERLYSLHHIAATQKEAAKLALEAGVDMDMNSGTLLHLLELVREGRISGEKVNEAVRRVLRIKFQLGLFEHLFVNPDAVDKIINSQKHRQLARGVARESIILLKNDGNLLPLSKDIGSIALIGPNADNPVNQLARTVEQPRKNIVTILDGVKNKVSSKTKIRYAEGCSVSGNSGESFDEATKTARDSDVAIVVVGEATGYEGIQTVEEGCDLADLNLSGVQEDLIKKIDKTGIPVIVILINGRPLSIAWTAEHIPAILEAWMPGEEGGNAVADILFGDYNPSGKLPITFPRTVGQLPVYYYHQPRFSGAGNGRYVFTDSTPLFPFGYGISYTRFEYSNLKIEPEKIGPAGKVSVSVNIENIGDMRGDEVAQLYVRDVVASVTRPVKGLKGFKKITLEPGEKRMINFTVTADQLALYNCDMNLVVEPGTFEVMVGGDSVNLIKGEFKVI